MPVVNRNDAGRFFDNAFVSNRNTTVTLLPVVVYWQKCKEPGARAMKERVGVSNSLPLPPLNTNLNTQIAFAFVYLLRP